MTTQRAIEMIRRARVPGVPALALYVLTLIVELPVLLMRMILTLLVAALALLVLRGSASGAYGYWELALAPSGWAILALLTPFGGARWWRVNLGGRPPSERERLAYQDAVGLLQAHAPAPLVLPRLWFVLDGPQPDAAVCGDALMLSRGLLESDFVAPVLAHELGHLATSDGKLTAAINRLVITLRPWRQERQPRERPTFVLAGDAAVLGVTAFGALLSLVRCAVRFAQGGLGVRLLAPLWASYWREREYGADAHAARLGQAEELADFLEVHALIHDHPVPFIWLSDHTHPPTELRIDRLRKASARDLAVAPGPEPVKAAPAGPPAAGPDGPALTEPAPSAEELSGRQGRPCRPAGHLQ
jgi:Zn-dependent protease with chaperone function